MTAALGRALQPADDVRGGSSVLALSHATWRDRFGSDPVIPGRTLTLDGESQTVLGVMPAAFDYPRGAECWAPLAPGLSAADAVWKTEGRPGPQVGSRVTAMPFEEHVVGPTRRAHMGLARRRRRAPRHRSCARDEQPARGCYD